MIEINLVPAALRKNEARGVGVLASINLPQEVVLGFGGIVVGVLVLVHLILLMMWFTKSFQYFSYKSSWQAMASTRKIIDSTNEELKDFKGKISTITDITSKNAILWSRDLNILSDAVPKGIWFRRILWDSRVLIIEGSVFSKAHDEIAMVEDFVSNLKKEESFVKNFSLIEVNSVNLSLKSKSTTEVADFKITAKTK